MRRAGGDAGLNVGASALPTGIRPNEIAQALAQEPKSESSKEQARIAVSNHRTEVAKPSEWPDVQLPTAPGLIQETVVCPQFETTYCRNTCGPKCSLAGERGSFAGAHDQLCGGFRGGTAPPLFSSLVRRLAVERQYQILFATR